MYLVPFISKRWEQLPHCHGTDDRLRVELEALLDPRDQSAQGEARRVKALDTVNDCIFHQQSTYPSTYVTVPYLVHNLERFDRPMQHSIIDTITWISTQGNPHGDLREAELAAYDQSLILLEPKVEQLLKQAGQSPEWCDTWNALNLLGRLATLRGLDTIGSQLRHGEEETDFECQHCGTSLQSRGPTVTYDAATFVAEEVLLSYAESFEQQYLLPLSRTVVDRDDAESVSTVFPRHQFAKPTTRIAVDADGAERAAMVHQWSRELGHPKVAAWLRNFYGFAHCPKCGYKHDLAKTLTD